MSVRKFKLINSTGAEWDLMRKDGFLYEPNGLGLERSNEYMRIGSTYELIESISAQKTAQFRMIFKNYAIYRQFIEFIAYKPLKLAYKPMTEWAYIDGEITNIDKSEIDYSSHVLDCQTTFTATSLWYVPRTARKTADEIPNAKKYTYAYAAEYDYCYKYADELNGYIRVTNNSAEYSPSKITMIGALTNPAWYVSVNNDVISAGQVFADIPEGHKLVINSKDGALEVAEYEVGTDVLVRNMYQFTDFTKETFVTFPPGNSTLFVNGSVGTSIEAWVEVEEVHESI